MCACVLYIQTWLSIGHPLETAEMAASPLPPLEHPEHLGRLAASHFHRLRGRQLLRETLTGKARP